MFPHTPDKTKIPRHQQESHLKKKTKKKYKYGIDHQHSCHLPPHKLQGCKSCRLSFTQIQGWTSYRRQTSQTLSQTNPSPTARNQFGQRQLTYIQRTHEPVARRTRSQINPKDLAQQVDIIPRQASQRQFPRVFIYNWAMPVMDKVTGETLEHRQLRRQPK